MVDAQAVVQEKISTAYEGGMGDWSPIVQYSKDYRLNNGGPLGGKPPNIPPACVVARNQPNAY